MDAVLNGKLVFLVDLFFANDIYTPMAKETCIKCDYTYYPAPSKRAGRCPNCEHIARHGVSIEEAKRAKQKQYRETSQRRAEEKMRLAPPKQSKPIPKFSRKGKSQAIEVAATKKQLKLEATDGQEYAQCEGCTKWFKGLDASHKIPLSQSSALASDPNNIRLLCRDCHNKWENGTMTQMAELEIFEEDMLYLLDMDPERFWKLYHRLVDEADNTQNPKLITIIESINFSLDNG